MAGASHEVLKEEFMQAVADLTKFLETSVQLEPHLTVDIEIRICLVERWRGSRWAIGVVIFRHGIKLLGDVSTVYRHGLASDERRRVGTQPDHSLS